jgi:muramidase (phage lysozyme)
MADRDVIKEFLVSIGYDLDSSSAKKVSEATAKLEKQIVDGIKRQTEAEKRAADEHKKVTRDAVLQARLWGDAIEEAGRRIVSSVANITSGFENLYYLSKRTNSSVSEIKQFGYAISQMGGTAASAYASLEALGEKMRGSNNAFEGVFRQFGVGKGSWVSEIVGLGKALSDAHKTTAEAKAIFASVGVTDDRVWLPLFQQADEIAKKRAELQQKYRNAGLDPDKVGEQARDFDNALGSMGSSLEALQAKLVSALLQKPQGGGQSIIEKVTSMVDQLAHALADKDVQTTIAGITDAAVALAGAIGDVAKQLDNLAKATPGGYATLFKAALGSWVGDKLGGPIGGAAGGVLGALSGIKLPWSVPNMKPGVGLGLTEFLHSVGGYIGIGGAHAGELPANDNRDAAMARAAAQLQRIADLLFQFLTNSGLSGVLGGAGAAGSGGYMGAGLSAGVGVAGASAPGQSAWGHAKRIAGNVLRGVGIKTTLGTSEVSDASLAPEQRAILDAVSAGEGANYNTIAGAGRGNMGAPGTFSDYSQHPNIPAFRQPDGRVSTGAGRYQFEHSTWEHYRKKYNLPDFSPASQDRGAWYDAADHYSGATGRDLLADLKAKRPGTLEALQASLMSEWAAAPQGKIPGVYASRVGVYANEAAAVRPAIAPHWSFSSPTTGHNWSQLQGLATAIAKNPYGAIPGASGRNPFGTIPGLVGPTSQWAPTGGSKSVASSQKTNIHIYGSGDPHETASMVAKRQERLHTDMVRNLQGAVA